MKNAGHINIAYGVGTAGRGTWVLPGRFPGGHGAADMHARTPEPNPSSRPAGESLMDRGKTQRQPYYHSGISVVIEHPSGGVAQCEVTTQELGAREITFMHRGFLHCGTLCKLSLPTLDKREKIKVEGRVVMCRYAEGGLHEVLVAFDQPINLRDFVASGAGWDAAERAELAGCVLVIEADEALGRLMMHQLRDTALDLTVVPTLREGLNAIRIRAFDLVIVDLDDPPGPQQMVEALHSAGYRGPILGLRSAIRAKSSGGGGRPDVDTILQKPYKLEEFLSTLRTLLVSNTAAGEPILSTLRDQPNMKGVISWYVQRAKQIVEDAVRFAKADNRDGLIEQCQTLYETAAGYGFEILGQAAYDVIQAAQTPGCELRNLPQLRALQNIAQRMR